MRTPLSASRLTDKFYSHTRPIIDFYLFRCKNRALRSENYVPTVSIGIRINYVRAIRSLEIIWLRWTGKCLFFTKPAKTEAKTTVLGRSAVTTALPADNDRPAVE